MSFWTTLGQVGGGAADSYFRNNLGEKWDQARRKKAVSDELAGLKPHAPDAKQQAAFDAENAKMAAEDNALINDPAASGDMPVRTQGDYQYGTPVTAPISEDERYARMEDIYRRHGFDDRADQYGLRAYNIKRDNKQDARQAIQDASAERMNALNATNLEMRNTEAAYQQAQREAAENFASAIATAKANGEPLDFNTQMAVAGQYGVNQQNMQAAMIAANNLDKAEVERARDARIQKAATAAEKGGLNGMINLFNTDPDFNDSTSVSATKTKNGMVVLTRKTNDGKVLHTSQPMTEQEAIVSSLTSLKDQTASLKMHMEIEDHKAKQALQKAQAYNATQSGNLAGAQAAIQQELAAAKTAAAQARMEAVNAKSENHSKAVNDGVRQIALMHGATTDAFGNYSYSGVDPDAYGSDIAMMEKMVRSGIPPMEAANTIMRPRTKASAATKATENAAPVTNSVNSVLDKFNVRSK